MSGLERPEMAGKRVFVRNGAGAGPRFVRTPDGRPWEGREAPVSREPAAPAARTERKESRRTPAAFIPPRPLRAGSIIGLSNARSLRQPFQPRRRNNARACALSTPE